jgi:ABC-type nickel/cobalt efflux system permease component RcnA
MLSAISAVVVVALGLGMLRRELSHRAAHRHEHDHTHTASAGATSLVALGLAGGLVPSASALVLLLGALAAHRPELGVLLVAGFGLGMAATLVGAGVALVAAGRVLDRAPLASRVMALAPLVTAVAVLAVGLGLTAQSLSALL